MNRWGPPEQWPRSVAFPTSRASPWRAADRVWSSVDMPQCCRRVGKQEVKQLDGHPLLSPPSLWRDLGLTATPRRNCCLPRLGRFTHLSVVSRVVRAVLVDCWTAVSVSFVLAGRPGECQSPGENNPGL